MVQVIGLLVAAYVLFRGVQAAASRADHVVVRVLAMVLAGTAVLAGVLLVREPDSPFGMRQPPPPQWAPTGQPLPPSPGMPQMPRVP